MRTLIALFSVLMACNASASTVMLTLSGRVSETDAAQFFALPPVSVGDTWTVTAIYEHPNPAIHPPDWLLQGYGLIGDTLTFQVSGLFWTGQLGVEGLFDSTFDRAGFFSSQPVPSAIPAPAGSSSSTLVRLWGPPGMISDRTSLPNGFEDWNLPATNVFSLEVVNALVGGGAWRIKANTFDTISIQVIPEPGAVTVSGLFAALFLSRRRRWMPAL